MNLSTILTMALHAITRHFFRSVLSMLGIIFGITSVITMLAIGEGAKQQALKRIEAMGLNNIIIESIVPEQESEEGETEGGGGSSYGLREDDFRHFVEFENTSRITRLRYKRTPLYIGAQATDITVVAADTSLQHALRLRPQIGRFITDMDAERKSRICVAGTRAMQIIAESGGIDKTTLDIGGYPFTRVGVFDSQSSASLPGKGDSEKSIIVPLASYRELFGTAVEFAVGTSRQKIDIEYDAFIIEVKDRDSIPATAARCRAWLSARHKQLDYSITLPLALLQQEKESREMFNMVMIAIASISLLVGGIGIMNIMLANVYERTRDIGILRAIGARRNWILIQFISEAVFTTGLGGAIGVIGGLLTSLLISKQLGWPMAVSVPSIIIAFTISAGTGVIFGTYPAWRAARVSPLEALRHE